MQIKLEALKQSQPENIQRLARFIKFSKPELSQDSFLKELWWKLNQHIKNLYY
jgi:hypothetical protein